ncbi:MAG: DUF5011 domain-containing protein [Bacteroidales bacterium]|nr:DUF5011 domain-containing protein [Bacteroidales bacterium]
MKCFFYKYTTSGLRYFYTSFLSIFILLLLVSCEKWNQTSDISQVSQLPTFELNGDDFLVFVPTDTGEYTDAGARAFEGDKELAVYSFGEVDLTKKGVYLVYYYAENSFGLSAIGERVVAVTSFNTATNDLSGWYEGTLWEPMANMRVSKVDEKGLYKCTEVFGYPGSEVKGRFVDLGNNELVLLPGNGDFGSYAMSEGGYSRSALTWSISLLDDPYKGIDIQVVWSKIKE